MVNAEVCAPYQHVDHSAINNHVREVLANGDERIYQYLMDWMAHLLQFPHIKLLSCVSIRESQGCGKSSFFHVFGNQLLGSNYFLVVSNANDVMGQFNSEIESKIFVVFEEAYGEGTKRCSLMIPCGGSQVHGH